MRDQVEVERLTRENMGPGIIKFILSDLGTPRDVKGADVTLFGHGCGIEEWM